VNHEKGRRNPETFGIVDKCKRFVSLVVYSKRRNMIMTETLTMKEIVEKAMENLPEEDTIDVAMERLLVLSKIEEGLKDVANGDVYTQEEVEAMLGEWLK